MHEISIVSPIAFFSAYIFSHFLAFYISLYTIHPQLPVFMHIAGDITKTDNKCMIKYPT